MTKFPGRHSTSSNRVFLWSSLPLCSCFEMSFTMWSWTWIQSSTSLCLPVLGLSVLSSPGRPQIQYVAEDNIEFLILMSPLTSARIINGCYHTLELTLTAFFHLQLQVIRGPRTTFPYPRPMKLFPWKNMWPQKYKVTGYLVWGKN